jgi:hypothetical protein
LKHNTAISFALTVTERSRGSEKRRRSTLLDAVLWRFAEQRATSLGLDFEDVVTEVSSRSTAWRAEKQGATPQLIEKVEERLAEIERERGLPEGLSEKFREWCEVGGQLLLMNEQHFDQALDGAREVLDASRKLREGIAVFKKKPE